MTRAERLGLEPGSVSDIAEKRDSEGERHLPLAEEIAHSLAISLKRIADALDDVVRGAQINVETRSVS